MNVDSIYDVHVSSHGIQLELHQKDYLISFKSPSTFQVHLFRSLIILKKEIFDDINYFMFES